MTDEDSSWKGDDYNIDTYDNGGGRMSVDNYEEGRGASLDMFNRVEEIAQITQVEAETRIYIYIHVCLDAFHGKKRTKLLGKGKSVDI